MQSTIHASQCPPPHLQTFFPTTVYLLKFPIYSFIYLFQFFTLNPPYSDIHLITLSCKILNTFNCKYYYAASCDPLTPYYICHFLIFDKSDSFLKNDSNVLGNKKGKLLLWRTAWFTYKCSLAFFLFHCQF